MSKLVTLSLAAIALFVQCIAPGSEEASSLEPERPIVVGVFDGYGGAQICVWETVAAIQLDQEMRARTITSADIANHVLDSIDAIIIPGGGGKRQFLNLGALNRQRIKEFIAKGKGAVGICAGAYLFSSTPDYACMHLNGEQAIDIEHDNRGHGMVKFRLNEEGKKLFLELGVTGQDTFHMVYYEGPVFVKNEQDSIRNTLFGTMESDVHEEGNAPANMTNGKPFFLGNSYGKGRVFSCIGHPEATPGMMWMVSRMVRWTLRKPSLVYQPAAVQPFLFDRELLMTAADLKEEAACFSALFDESDARRIAALDWLEAHRSWDARRWVQGMLYDASPAVRLRAARYVADGHYLHFQPDLRSAYLSETDEATKKLLRVELNKLEVLKAYPNIISVDNQQ